MLREIGVDTGGSNVQFAVNPRDGQLIIIEMNPRVSRSSALASKATGFPIAKIAAKLAVGYTLDELDNDITGVTPASFEPTIDYVVTKVPRFTFEKFPGTEPTLSTQMKSVGEAMSIGRTFQESGKRPCVNGNGAERAERGGDPGCNLRRRGHGRRNRRGRDPRRLEHPNVNRILVVAQALRHGLGIDAIHQASGFDPGSCPAGGHSDAENDIRENGLPSEPARCTA